MSIRNLVILSQLNPPAQRDKVLARERINQLLEQATRYPLTVLEAGTGYGKSTAILSFIAHQSYPTYWFTVSGTDRDPNLFLAKLFSAFNQHDNPIGDEALRILDMEDATQQEALIALINSISMSLSDESLLILDDFHRVSDIKEIIRYIDWIIENLPQNLHLILASRHSLEFPNINKWRVKGGILEITKDHLVFNDEETIRLFEEHYHIKLSDNDMKILLNKTEGWVIGLQMVWQTMQNNPSLNIASVLEGGRLPKTALFEYLAEEVLTGLDAPIQEFLIKTSILSKLDSSTCDFVMQIQNSEIILSHLNNSGLFLEELRPGVYRYHQMFREFLLNRLQRDVGQTRQLHRKVASYFQAHEYWEEAIFHLLASQDYLQVNRILENIGKSMINGGRHETIHYWICEIPEDIRKTFPHLMFLLGEVNRYLGSFNEALEYYHIAERLYRSQRVNTGISMALRGQAQVFLDTIRPVNADQLLQDALKLLNPVDHRDEIADLLVLTAENQLNLGFPESAESLIDQAKTLRPELDMETDFIRARVLLRTGRLREGIELLQSRELRNPLVSRSRPQRFHRESPLLLSLFYAITGKVDLAEQYARQGIEFGELLQSSFVQSVGYMRLGHALLLKSQHPFENNNFEKAIYYFEESIEKVDVTRIHVEPLWGMCRALGYAGQLNEAEELARESLDIAKKAGDEWISVLIQLSIGAGAVLAGEFEIAQHYLTSAETTALKVKDPFVLCVARMWLAIRAWRQGFLNTAFGYIEKLLPVVKERGYEFLLIRESLMGLKDPDTIIPVLLEAFHNNIEKSTIKELLSKRNLEIRQYHPGYSLWVKTLGGFTVWRGDQVVESMDWKREKAQELFQLLIANKGKWLRRDHIISILWADSRSENESSYFKVILNTLNQVLEPNRPRGEPPYFIDRQGDSYRINPSTRIILDTDVFLENIQKGTRQSLEYALSLYLGEYFENTYIQEWLVIEQQFFHQKFLLTADQLIEKYLSKAEFEKALDVTYIILSKDSLWEAAYRSQMIIFKELGRPSMVREVFRQCQNVFNNRIDSQVSTETYELYREIMSG